VVVTGRYYYRLKAELQTPNAFSLFQGVAPRPEASSLIDRQERLRNGVFQSPAIVTDQLPDHCSIRVKDDCLRNGDGRIALIEIVVERGRGESHFVIDRELCDKITDLFAIVFVVLIGQSDDDQPIFAMRSCELDQLWNLLATGPAPCRP